MITSFVLRPGLASVRYLATATPKLQITINANPARFALSLRVLQHVLFEFLAAEKLQTLFALVVGVLARHVTALFTLWAY